MSRIASCFAALRRAQRAAFLPFITAGDPDLETSFEILKSLPAAGADIVELGVPFSDPMADGPAIQASSQRALAAGITLPAVLELTRRFRTHDSNTPLVLMGYSNPIHAYGAERFVREAALAGVDGLITVDLPPEEDEILRAPARAHGLDIVRLVTPTTDGSRLATILNGASGFLYYVSIAGVTGTKSFSTEDVERAVTWLRKQTRIPCVVGFGIKTPTEAGAIARIADGAVVGSAIVNRIAEGAAAGQSRAALARIVAEFCSALADSVHAARPPAVVQ